MKKSMPKSGSKR